jgi:phosphatidate cytidylyltransferase
LLRWRLILGVTFVAGLLGLCWLDAYALRPGAWLGALAIAAVCLCAGELLAMMRARGLALSAKVFYAAAILPVAFSCVPVLFPNIMWNLTLGAYGWLTLGVLAGLAMAFVGEMPRFDGQGNSLTNIAVTAFAALYLGGCIGSMVQLRIVRAPAKVDGWDGLLPLLLLIATVKLSDIGQYTVGRTIGRTKLAPRISPGKTWEGAVGGIALACLVVSLGVGMRRFGWANLSWSSFGVMMAFTASVAVAGLIGDLSESMLKRAAGFKDSSTWMPGFGGVLDLVDSLLLSAPVAYLWFVNGFLDYKIVG